MSKIFGSISKNDKKSNERQPDLRGYIKLGGHRGKGAEERNRESASWLRNIAKEFSENKQCFINIAGWKREDHETGDHYISLSLEDNAWRTRDGGSGEGGHTSGNAQSSGGGNTQSSTEDIDDDIPF